MKGVSRFIVWVLGLWVCTRTLSQTFAFDIISHFCQHWRLFWSSSLIRLTSWNFWNLLSSFIMNDNYNICIVMKKSNHLIQHIIQPVDVNINFIESHFLSDARKHHLQHQLQRPHHHPLHSGLRHLHHRVWWVRAVFILILLSTLFILLTGSSGRYCICL